jgi:DNA repair exonuclease SbcCD ATPase subunit
MNPRALAPGGRFAMTRSHSGLSDFRPSRWLVLSALLLMLVAFSAGSGPVRAEETADAISPVEQFSRQLEEFQKSVPDLNKKIQDSTGAIDSWTDVEKARGEIEKLREAVGSLLGAVSDNGAVSQLGVKALNQVHDKLRALAQETRFKPEERQFLIDQWRKLEDETTRATKELDDARKQFVELLRTLQSNEDFIVELLQIRQAQKALDVIRKLTQDIRDASNQLSKLIGGIKPPGA